MTMIPLSAVDTARLAFLNAAQAWSNDPSHENWKLVVTAATVYEKAKKGLKP